MIKKCNFASVKYKQWSSTKVYIKTNNKLKRKKIRRFVNTYNIQWTIKLSIWCERKIRVLENQIRKITIYYLFLFSFHSFLCLHFFLRFQLVKSKSEKEFFSSNFRFPLKSIRIICSSSDPDMTLFRLTKNILPKENNRWKRIDLIEFKDIVQILYRFLPFNTQTNT